MKFKLSNIIGIVVLSMFMTSLYLALTDRIHYSLIQEAEASPAPTEPPKNCPLYVQPKLPELPSVDPITDRMINDRKLAEEHMLNIIKEHRKALIETNKIIEASYQEYVKKCLETQEGKSKQ